MRPGKRSRKSLLVVISVFFILLSSCTNQSSEIPITGPEDQSGNIYLPLVINGTQPVVVPTAVNTPLIHIPYKNVDNLMQNGFGEMTVFWFGEVRANDNYVDVRTGYTDSELVIYLAIFDRLLWYDRTPENPATLIDWDAVTLYIMPSDQNQLNNTAVKLVGQLAPVELDRQDYQASYRWNGSSWQIDTFQFSSSPLWRGEGGLNTPDDNRGWTIEFSIPFSSFGLGERPADFTGWKLGISMHDRDYLNDTGIAPKHWPTGMEPGSPETWGTLSFSIPSASSGTNGNGTILEIQHGLNGFVVPDASPGDTTLCGEGIAFWTEWGDRVHQPPESLTANIQNQRDIADWPCYSKYYIKFPIDSLTSNQEIISATLTLHQFGNSGTWGDPVFQPYRSLIQAFITDPNWRENTLTWNNAPPPIINIDRTWVDPLPEFPGWPGVPSEWDITLAVRSALENDQDFVSVALYSADGAYHSGKYFSTSDVEDWNQMARPKLTILYQTP